MEKLDLACLRQQKSAILQLCEKYYAHNVRIFGSVAREDNTEQSDVDLLIDMPGNVSILKQVALQQALTELLKRRVDVVITEDLHPYIKDQVLQECLEL